ncbi:MAG: nucleotide sugar dehydrogenase [Proteobacteria bacterium]|nr:nucleotide sugar dehydrogenase [Pseudomonadota bacterium]
MSAANEHIVVVGLGYVGLPLALALAREFGQCAGFDVDTRKIETLAHGIDPAGEVDSAALETSSLVLTADPQVIRNATFIIVAVPTPVDENRQPDLRAMLGACETIGAHLQRGAVVVFESTVWPGVTDDVCGPSLEAASGLKRGTDFFLGYSPERINPGDREHQLQNVIKVVAGEDAATLQRVAAVYERIVPAGLHQAPSIKVAEAAKVIENTQRDLNIALMNELAMIFDRFNIATRDVLAAAGTKWNFLPFTPGLVGGHCIGVDPYYLTARAKQAGYYPQLILTGRRINDGISSFIANKVLRLLIDTGKPVKGARIGILGVTFKENVHDLRNSRVPEIIHELAEFGLDVRVHDPMADAGELHDEYGLETCGVHALHDIDLLMLAVPHTELLPVAHELAARLGEGGIVMDVKSKLSPESLPAGVTYWSL